MRRDLTDTTAVIKLMTASLSVWFYKGLITSQTGVISTTIKQHYKTKVLVFKPFILYNSRSGASFGTSAILLSNISVQINTFRL